MMVGLPFLILLIWKTSPIQPKQLRNNLISICQQNRLRVFDVRRWDTGDQVVNAVVAGMLPRFRLILLSDGLLNHFKINEIQAVLRHEAGHIRLWHLPTRMVFLILPLLAMAFCDWSICDSQEFWVRPATTADVLCWLEPQKVLTVCTMALYVFLTTRWLSHQIEFEADIYAIQNDSQHPINPAQAGNARAVPSISPDRANDMQNALWRLAAISPGELDRCTFFHPSIRQRIDFIERVKGFGKLCG